MHFRLVGVAEDAFPICRRGQGMHFQLVGEDGGIPETGGSTLLKPLRTAGNTL